MAQDRAGRIAGQLRPHVLLVDEPQLDALLGVVAAVALDLIREWAKSPDGREDLRLRLSLDEILDLSELPVAGDDQRTIADELADAGLDAGAALDRLIHRCHVLEANGQSYRLLDATQRAKRKTQPKGEHPR